MPVLGRGVRPNDDAFERSFKAAGIVGLASVPLFVVTVIADEEYTVSDLPYSLGHLAARLTIGTLATWGVARGATRRWRLRKYGLVLIMITFAVTALLSVSHDPPTDDDTSHPNVRRRVASHSEGLCRRTAETNTPSSEPVADIAEETP